MPISIVAVDSLDPQTTIALSFVLFYYRSSFIYNYISSFHAPSSYGYPCCVVILVPLGKSHKKNADSSVSNDLFHYNFASSFICVL